MEKSASKKERPRLGLIASGKLGRARGIYESATDRWDFASFDDAAVCAA